MIYYATTPIRVRKGGVLHGDIFVFFNLCFGGYCLPLYLQMVGWRQIAEAASLGHKPPCTNGKKATESPILRGFRLLWAILVTLSLSALYHKQRQNQYLSLTRRSAAICGAVR